MTRQITWRRLYDGALFSGWIVRSLPEHSSVVCVRSDTGQEVVVHLSNILED